MKSYWKITLTYLAFGLMWILVTDLASLYFSPDVKTLATIEIIKGWFYVIASSSLIFYLTRQAFRREAAANEEKLAVYQKTVSGVHHILLNYLNQMQVVTMEAENLDEFDKETLELAKSISDEAAESLNRLREIQCVSVEGIHSAAFGAD